MFPDLCSITISCRFQESGQLQLQLHHIWINSFRSTWMDDGPLGCISSDGIPTSHGAFPHFTIPTACSTSASNGGGSRSSGLRVDNDLSFTGFTKRLAPYSCYLSTTSYGNVKAILFLSFVQALFAWKGRFFTYFTLLFNFLAFPNRSYSSICAHSFSSQAVLSLRIIFCVMYFKVYCKTQFKFWYKF